MSADTAAHDNGNNDKCGAALWVSDRSELTITAPRDIVVYKTFSLSSDERDACTLQLLCLWQIGKSEV